MKFTIIALGVVSGLVSLHLATCDAQDVPNALPRAGQVITSASLAKSMDGAIAQTPLQVYNDPVMAISTRYPNNMKVEAGCSREGCGYFFQFKPQKNALDNAEVHIFLPKGAKTAAEVEKLITGNGGLLQTNGWKWDKDATSSENLMYPWVKKIITFTAENEMTGHILLGETHGQGVQVTLIYPAEMSNAYWTYTKTVLDNLKFKADKLPLQGRSQ